MKHNFVAKHAQKFNRSAVHKDRKKAMKRGEHKHKNKLNQQRDAIAA